MRLFLKKNIKRRILNGHPWIYDNEIEKIEGEVKPGDIIEVYLSGNYIGKGYYNPYSKIKVRLLTRKNEKIDKEWFVKKFDNALKYRKKFLDDLNAFRLIYGESDGIPGLIIDKFDNYFVLQTNTLGIKKLKNFIIDALIELFKPDGIFLKDDRNAARKENFQPEEGWIYGKELEFIFFKFKDLAFIADTKGQKTGFFLDQRYNAYSVRKVVENKKILDVFSYTGQFGINALKAGAKFVRFVDYSERALNVLEENLRLNQIEKGRFELIKANAFDLLKKYDLNDNYFDIVILDPPSLAKSKESKNNAFRGYKELNLRSIKILKYEGVLFTSSCTQIISKEEFKGILYSAFSDIKRLGKIFIESGQPPDHPYVLNINETQYLKFFGMYLERI